MSVSMSPGESGQDPGASACPWLCSALRHKHNRKLRESVCHSGLILGGGGQTVDRFVGVWIVEQMLEVAQPFAVCSYRRDEHRDGVLALEILELPEDVRGSSCVDFEDVARITHRWRDSSGVEE